MKVMNEKAQAYWDEFWQGKKQPRVEATTFISGIMSHFQL